MSTEGGSALPVNYAPLALRDLDLVWDWNVKTYGPAHAARYVDFLQLHIERLGETHPRGSVVESRPELRYIRVSRRTRGHGHIAVYRVDADADNVLHIFHTAQDWQTKLAEEAASQ